MVGKVRMTGRGPLCQTEGADIYLDPKRASSSGINFISHAHTDHLPSSNGGTILTSFETRMIAGMRGFRMEEHTESAGGVRLVDSGHILGSNGLWADDVFYTGDICTRDRGFLKGARVPKCRTLITECTFGLPEFDFPGVRDTVSAVNRIISEMYSRGTPVILMGYQLGKAQTLTHLFGHWDPLYCHDDIKRMNDLHRDLGVPLRDAMGHTEAAQRGLLGKRPWVMIAPPLSGRGAFVQEMKSMYGAATIGFTGWAKSARVSFGRRCDITVPLSDHCDFGELVQMVADSGAEKIYAVHGFVDEFAAHLRKLGFDAQPLREGGLDSFT